MAKDNDSATLAALNRVKALAPKWEAETARLAILAELKTDPADRAEVTARAQAFAECAREIRDTAKGR
jgi:erythromycin esterase-like protein